MVYAGPAFRRVVPALGSGTRRAGHGDGGALQGLARLDEDVARALKTYGSPPDRSLPASFDTLARAIVGQQVSRTAASSIWNRMEAASLTHETVIANSSADVMMIAGLSRRKAEYLILNLNLKMKMVLIIWWPTLSSRQVMATGSDYQKSLN